MNQNCKHFLNFFLMSVSVTRFPYVAVAGFENKLGSKCLSGPHATVQNPLTDNVSFILSGA